MVGAGGVAARHARALALLPQAHLIAVTDVDLGQAAWFAAGYGVQVVPDPDIMLDAGLDAMYVCLPPFMS